MFPFTRYTFGLPGAFHIISSSHCIYAQHYTQPPERGLIERVCACVWQVIAIKLSPNSTPWRGFLQLDMPPGSSTKSEVLASEVCYL
jgi:hypothetical protein